MNRCKILSGDQLIDKGITKINASLPELGLKDVVPNGSWLEQKQIQGALEARMHLIKVDRIEKCHHLSHAEWRDDLCLAEVTQKLGGHWQFIGHNVGSQLYLLPEEALYLMETNCLLLKHNEVTVSLQKAYALLLQGSTTIPQYKVYAFLSRLGYKILRHKTNTKDTKISAEVNDNENLKAPGVCNISNENVDTPQENNIIINENLQAPQDENNIIENMEAPQEEKNLYQNVDCPLEDNFIIENQKAPQKENTLNDDLIVPQEENILYENLKIPQEDNITHEDVKTLKTETNINEESYPEIDILVEASDSSATFESNIINENGEKESVDKQFKHKHTDNVATEDNCMDSTDIKESILVARANTSNADMLHHDQQNLPTSSSNVPIRQMFSAPTCVISKSQELRNRQIQPCNAKKLHKTLEHIPDFTKDTVTINAPEEQHIPRNIYLNNSTYTLKVDNIKSKVVSNNHSAKRTYSISDNEVSGAHVRRVKEACNRNAGLFSGYYNQFFGRQPQLRPFTFWRPPQENLNFFPLHMIFQRHFAPNVNFSQRHFLPRNMPRYFRPNPLVANININDENINRKRAKEARSAQQNSLNSIKKLAAKLRQMILLRNVDQQNIVALHRVLHAYNTTYKAKLRLTNDFDIIDDVETITLEDDDETKPKKPRLASDENLNSYGDNLNKLKQIASKLKDLGDPATSTRHKRAMSNAIKTFNKSYKADVYLNSNFEIIDRRQIILDSSSDSDCAVEEPVKKVKKLRNPFNVLKQLSDKSRNIASTSKEAQSGSNTSTVIDNNKYSEKLLKLFTSDWLPPVDDFGRAEICKYSAQHIFNIKKEEFIVEFIENHPMVFNNWWEAKVAFYENLEASNKQFEIIQKFEVNSDVAEPGIKPIIGPGDGTDMESILKKLSIIKNNKEVNESSLKIDFDMYNRDVPNFRKTLPPVPHFRIVCLCETSSFPSGADIISLHSKYDDQVTILFAIVGTGSIKFIQINPSDVPVYLPSSDTDMP